MSLSARLQKHMVAAAAVAAGTAATANAAIVYSGLVNLTVPNTFAGVYLNLQTGATGTSSGSNPGWDINPYGNGYLRLFQPTGGGYMQYPAGTGAGNLDAGQTIGAASTWVTYPNANPTFGAAAGQWKFNADNLLGVRFLDASSAVRYGWVRFRMGADANSKVIVDWAYEDTGGDIGAGVPAPGALALLGVAGLAGRRRRR
ncbi:MAG: hypothetical protein U0625_04855 [Phycisphaerales bacterium]